MKINISKNIKRTVVVCTLLFLTLFIYFPEFRTPKDTHNSGEYLVDMDDMVKKDVLLLIKDIVQLKFPYTIESITSYLKIKKFSVEEYPVPGIYYTEPKNLFNPLNTIIIKSKVLDFNFRACITDDNITNTFGDKEKIYGRVASYTSVNSKTNVNIHYRTGNNLYSFTNARIKDNQVCFTSLNIYSFNSEDK